MTRPASLDDHTPYTIHHTAKRRGSIEVGVAWIIYKVKRASCAKESFMATQCSWSKIQRSLHRLLVKHKLLCKKPRVPSFSVCNNIDSSSKEDENVADRSLPHSPKNLQASHIPIHTHKHVDHEHSRCEPGKPKFTGRSIVLGNYRVFF